MSEAMTATARVKSIQRAALAMLVAAGVINDIDRATLATPSLTIRQDLGLSIADMGHLLSAFLWAYAFSQLPTGAMVDKFGPRFLLTSGLGVVDQPITAADLDAVEGAAAAMPARGA